jgi:hypothetical protein
MQPRTNSQILSEHRELLTRSRWAGSAVNSMTRHTFSDPAQSTEAAAAVAPSLRDVAALAPAYVASLVAGATHGGGRVLRCAVVGEAVMLVPVMLRGTMMIVEDERGDYCALASYNRVRSQPEADSLFPLGTRLIVVEPVLTGAQDGRRGIRVDRPDELIVLSGDAVPGRPWHVDRAEARKAEGNQRFAERHFGAAIASYTRALQHLVDAHPAAASISPVLLLHTAACHLQLGQAERALEAAVAAIALAGDPSTGARGGAELGEAFAHAGLAAHQLDAPAAARWAMLEAARLRGDSDRGATLLKCIAQPARATAALGARAEDGFALLLRELHRTVQLPSGAPSADARSGTDGTRSARASNEEGNGDARAALAQRAAAGAQLPGRALAATLLSNRAAAGLRLGTRTHLLGALRDARSALAVDPLATQPMARQRLVLALTALGWLAEAEGACVAGLAGLPAAQAAPLLELRAHLRHARAAQGATAAAGRPRDAARPSREADRSGLETPRTTLPS